MATAQRTRELPPQDITDDWLVSAARRAGHPVSLRDVPKGISAWRYLLGAGLTDETILKIACAEAGVDAADFSRASPALASLLPHAVALEHRVAPVGIQRGVLAIGTINPKSPELERVLAFASKQRVVLQAASPAVILRAQGVIYGQGSYGTNLRLEPQPPAAAPAMQPRPDVGRLSVAMAAPPEVHDAPAEEKHGPTNSPASLVDRLLSSAVAERASEAHLEPLPEGGIVVRMRVDGKLNDRFRATDANAARLIAGLKTIANLNVSEMRQPQSGRASFTTQHGAVSLRMTTEPVGVAQERVILKLFTDKAVREMAQLGLSTAELHRIGEILSAEDGAVFVAGPPASGKTTTLYAMLRDVQRRGRRVATIEEAVTYPMDGVAQTEVSTSPHLTRAAAVRATFALGADVVLADVPSDAETIESIAGSDTTGRVALASINAGDMASTIEKLHELDVDLHALSASVRGIISQRLVRRLCVHCASPQPVSELPESQQALVAGLPTDKLRRPVGCAECRGTGFTGRIAVAEIAPMTPALSAAIARRAKAPELIRIARDEGVTLLWDAGMHLVLQGITTLGELLDSVPPPQQMGAAPAEQGDIDALLKQLLGSQAMSSSAAPAPPAPVATPAAAAPATPIRMLLVDDDVVARRALATELRGLGVNVTEAADGETALIFSQRLRPDIVMTEIALPKLDGIGLAQALTAAGDKPVVVVYTSQADDELHVWFREVGARDILPRTMPARTIAERLRTLIS